MNNTCSINNFTQFTQSCTNDALASAKQAVGSLQDFLHIGEKVCLPNESEGLLTHSGALLDSSDLLKGALIVTAAFFAGMAVHALIRGKPEPRVIKEVVYIKKNCTRSDRFFGLQFPRFSFGNSFFSFEIQRAPRKFMLI